ncbi:sigma 54-interacting transcriptional regulator (plasmid) [Sinorhizobium meliloti]|nr:sigma 54-interacting transcriptional regulator [Sinorhizobium meliloti]
MSESRILLVDDEEELRRSSAQALELAGFRVDTFASAEYALERIAFSFHGVVISDIRMPGMDGMTFLQRIREIDAELPVILVTGHGDVQLAVRAMREGAYDFVEKPFTAQMLSGTIRRALDWRSLVLENRRLRAVAGKRDDIEQRLPGRSQAMVDLRYRIRAIGASDADTLIIGETGVGKEVVARALHDLSSRASGPFIAINCAALPENLIESELFGHEPGAFPGALRPRYGKFEHGRGGTILLDEIGSMPFDLQAKFLRVLQERVITRLGSNETVPLDVRFIATSKVDLEREVASSRFRADLLYRLNVATLRVPTLSQRRSDIPPALHAARPRIRRSLRPGRHRRLARARFGNGRTRVARQRARVAQCRRAPGPRARSRTRRGARTGERPAPDRQGGRLRKERHRQRPCGPWRRVEARLRVARHLAQDAV